MLAVINIFGGRHTGTDEYTHMQTDVVDNSSFKKLGTHQPEQDVCLISFNDSKRYEYNIRNCCPWYLCIQGSYKS